MHWRCPATNSPLTAAWMSWSDFSACKGRFSDAAAEAAVTDDADAASADVVVDVVVDVDAVVAPEGDAALVTVLLVVLAAELSASMTPAPAPAPPPAPTTKLLSGLVVVAVDMVAVVVAAAVVVLPTLLSAVTAAIVLVLLPVSLATLALSCGATADAIVAAGVESVGGGYRRRAALLKSLALSCVLGMVPNTSRVLAAPVREGGCGKAPLV